MGEAFGLSHFHFRHFRLASPAGLKYRIMA
jgi:hypothetical protein